MRVAVLGRDGEATRVLVNALARAHEVVVVVLERPEPRLEFLGRRARRLGLRRVAGELAFRALAMPLLRRRARARLDEIAREHGLDRSAVEERLVRRVDSVNDPGTVELLREARPNVVVLAGPRIVSGEVLRSVDAPFVNVHAGITPLYRGVHGGWWALERGDRANCGVTVHLVDEGVDTGGVLAQARIDPGPRDGFATYPLLQLAAGLPLLLDALPAVAAGEARTVEPPARESRLWTHPTIGEYLRARLRGVR
ncbi:MAG TPA: formyl transferase [Gaiellaceae bacterium]|nr:formyl transferase [Gaiellaceae bacterium]